jgi:hypothetical protein
MLYLRGSRGLSHLFSETALEFVLTAESRHFCAVVAQKATSLVQISPKFIKKSALLPIF